jgi:hypothetical protein
MGLMAHVAAADRWQADDDIALGKSSSPASSATSSGTACQIRTVLANNFFSEMLGSQLAMTKYMNGK